MCDSTFCWQTAGPDSAIRSTVRLAPIAYRAFCRKNCFIAFHCQLIKGAVPVLKKIVCDRVVDPRFRVNPPRNRSFPYLQYLQITGISSVNLYKIMQLISRREVESPRSELCMLFLRSLFKHRCYQTFYRAQNLRVASLFDFNGNSILIFFTWKKKKEFSIISHGDRGCYVISTAEFASIAKDNHFIRERKLPCLPGIGSPLSRYSCHR